MSAVLKFFGSPRRNKTNKHRQVDSLEGPQPCNPYTEIQVFSQHTDIIRQLIRIPDTRFASAGDDTSIIIWDIQTGKLLHVLHGHSRPITSLHYLDIATASGGKLLSAASDKLICMWDPDLGCLIKRLTDHESTARCFLTIPGGRYFCSGGSKLSLWSIDGCLIRAINRGKEEDIGQMIHLKEKRVVGVVDKRLVVYSMTERDKEEDPDLILDRRLPPHREAIKCLLNINDACFVSGSLDGTIILWSTQALAPSRYFNTIDDYLGENRVYPYSIQALVCLEERYLLCAAGTGLCVYDLIPGRMIAEKCHAHHSKILSMDLVHNGELLASVSEDGAVRLWGSHKICNTDQPVTNIDNTALSRLLGVSKEDLRLLREQNEKIEPHLVGECLGHAGAVQVCLDVGAEGFLTCAADGLIICWKDGLEQTIKRNGMLQDFYRRFNGPS